ncbi:MAG: DUF6301 family protein [Propionibacteriaceae bacterium]|nr:DUF6301 family protein [Propionibacteriaceae bacterium]
MRAIPFETAQHWIERLASLPAPVRMDDIPALAAEFGWESTKDADEYRYEEGGESRLILVSVNREADKIFDVSVDLVRNWDDDLVGNVGVVDWYVRYVEAARGVWGEPWSVMTDPVTFIWKFHEEGYAEIYLKPTLIACQFATSDTTEERW